LAVGLLERLAFVVELFAFAEAEEDFGEAAGIEIDLEGDEGQAFVVGLAGEFFALDGFHQQLAGPLGRVVPEGGLGIFGDVGADEPDFTFFDAGVSFVERQLAIAEAFDLAAHQLDAAFERVKNFEAVAGLAVFRNEADFGLFGFGGRLLFGLGHGLGAGETVRGMMQGTEYGVLSTEYGGAGDGKWDTGRRQCVCWVWEIFFQKGFS
jgi:hypothetical protein